MSFSQYEDIELETTTTNNHDTLSEAASSTNIKMFVDKIYLQLNEMDKSNARIKKKLQEFENIDAFERKKIRDML